ncbi:MAG TPA: AraC family transcriptional regulator, partial [bacterium]|nr:AraC family transcriptional regulator [bacterium]
LNDFMYDRPIKGTIEWKKQEVVIQIPVDAERIFYGVWLEGKGKIWVDDFVIEIVGEETPITAGRRILKRPRNLNLEE